MLPEEIKTKKKLFVAILIVIIVVLVLGAVGFDYYKTKILPLKLEKERVELEKEREAVLAAVQEALDKDEDCANVLAKVENYLKNKPSDVRIWGAKGICEFASGEYDEAKKSFEKVLALEPEHEAAKNYMKSLTGPAIITTIQRDLPDFFPQDMIIESDIELEVIWDDNIKFDERTVVMVSYESNWSVEENLSHFTDYLIANDFQFETPKGDEFEKVGIEGSEALFAEKDNEMIAVTIWKREPVQVSIAYIVQR